MSFVSLRGGAMLPPVCFPQAGFLCQNRHFAAKNGALTRIPKRKNAVARKLLLCWQNLSFFGIISQLFTQFQKGMKKPATLYFIRIAGDFGRKLVGLRGFEPPTLCTPCKCASQTALQPEKGSADSRPYRRICQTEFIRRTGGRRVRGRVRTPRTPFHAGRRRRFLRL